MLSKTLKRRSSEIKERFIADALSEILRNSVLLTYYGQYGSLEARDWIGLQLSVMAKVPIAD